MDLDVGPDTDRHTDLLAGRGAKAPRPAGVQAAGRIEDLAPGRRVTGNGAHSRIPGRTAPRGRSRTARPAAPRGRAARPSRGKAEAVPAPGNHGEIGRLRDRRANGRVRIGMQLGRAKATCVKRALVAPAVTEVLGAPVLATGNLGRARGAPRTVARTIPAA